MTIRFANFDIVMIRHRNETNGSFSIAISFIGAAKKRKALPAGSTSNNSYLKTNKLTIMMVINIMFTELVRASLHGSSAPLGVSQQATSHFVIGSR